MYAVIKTGGKQYRVARGDTLKVEKLDAGEGDSVEFDQVLMVGEGEDVRIGTPYIDGSRVTATVKGHGRGDKVEIIMSQPGWAFVSYTAPSGNTITGWVNSRFLDIDDPAAVANTDEEPIIPERLIEAAELEAAADSIE